MRGHARPLLGATVMVGCCLASTAMAQAAVWRAQSPCVAGALACGAEAGAIDLQLVVQGGGDKLRSDVRLRLAQVFLGHVTVTADEGAAVRAKPVLEIRVQRGDGATESYIAARLTDAGGRVVAALPWIRVEGEDATAIVPAVLYGLDVDPATLAPLRSRDHPTRNLQAFARYEAARDDYRAGHAESAIRLLQDAIHRDPMFAMAYWSIGIIVQRHPSLKPDDRSVDDWMREAAMIDSGHPTWRLDPP